jgi:N-acetylglutamate synthase-like GNAT family acetyltransferase
MSIEAIEPCGPDQLQAINRVIEAAIQSWPVTDRVKRLSLPVYRYAVADLDCYEIHAARIQGQLVGVVAWCHWNSTHEADRSPQALLHGIYVQADQHGRGVGAALLQQAVNAARASGHTAILAKASRFATGFFERQGFTRLDSGRGDYPYMYSLVLEHAAGERSRIIEMAWEDRTPFEAIEQQFGV